MPIQYQARIAAEDGSRIVTASYDKTARIWDAATAKEIAVLRGHAHTVWSAAFSIAPSALPRIIALKEKETARRGDILELSPDIIKKHWIMQLMHLNRHLNC